MKVFNFFKLIKVVPLLLLLFLSAFVCISADITTCQCGTFSTDIVSYQVQGADADCCTAQAFIGGEAYVYSYVQQDNGVWQLVDTQTITDTEGQNICCQ